MLYFNQVFRNRICSVQRLDEQHNKTLESPDDEGVPGEHLKLTALLNRFGFYPIWKQDEMELAGELQDAG